MTEVTAKYKLFLAVGMVVTGTLNTISTKERFQFRPFYWLKMGSGSYGNITFKLETKLFTWKHSKLFIHVTKHFLNVTKTNFQIMMFPT